MRLLDVKSMKLSEFFGEQIPRYTILSHCWGADEVTFQDIQGPSWMEKEGAKKIMLTCRQARLDKIRHVWIDTCCIDKTSSAELSEAINSMFSWYENARICYVYLEDVIIGEVPDRHLPVDDKIQKTRWFTRGWTLQELIAPVNMTFFDKDWFKIGNKMDLLELLSTVTRIPREVLRDPSSRHASSAARKMSWAAKRQTTRVEDSAYCLLGIFGVNMPLLYGEGTKAFIRLQEEILKETDDHSLLAWGLDTGSSGVSDTSNFVGVLAQSADYFLASADVIPFFSGDSQEQPALMTGRGLRIDVQILQEKDSDQTRRRVALLGCHMKNDFSNVLGLHLRCVESNIYIRIPGRVSCAKYGPQHTAKETIFILKNPPKAFSGTVYRVISPFAADIDFQVTDITPRIFTWNPTTNTVQFPQWDDSKSRVSFEFQHPELGAAFVVTHYGGAYLDTVENYGKRSLQISTKTSNIGLEEWLESNHTEACRSSGPIQLELASKHKVYNNVRFDFKVTVSIQRVPPLHEESFELKVDMTRKAVK